MLRVQAAVSCGVSACQQPGTVGRLRLPLRPPRAPGRRRWPRRTAKVRSPRRRSPSLRRTSQKPAATLPVPAASATTVVRVRLHAHAPRIDGQSEGRAVEGSHHMPVSPHQRQRDGDLTHRQTQQSPPRSFIDCRAPLPRQTRVLQKQAPRRRHPPPWAPCTVGGNHRHHQQGE